MSSKLVRKWLSEFKTIGKEELSDYVTQIHQNEQLIDELYDVFDEELSPEVIDPICHQLFDFFRSQNIGLQRFTLEFVPILCQTYLFALISDTANDKQKYGGIEACLLGIYNLEAARRDGQVEGKKVTIPMLARASIYHEPPSLASMALTENALLHSHPEKELFMATRPIPQLDCINSQNRLQVLTYIMNRYNAHIAFMSPRSHKTLCKLCSRLSRSGFDSVDYRSSVASTSGSSRSRTSSSSRRGVTIAAEPRIPLSSSYLIELLCAVYYALFNGYVRLGVQALEDIHYRASYELFTDVLLVTNAMRNSLQLNPSGLPKDGPMGISIILSPAQGNPVFAKDAITNASFRAKKLPEDIDVQDSAGQLDSSYHEDGSDVDAVVSLRTSESSEKTKASPLPKLSKGPLKSIMKKKEEKAAKDRGASNAVHRKESEVSSLSTARKGSHFKEFLELHAGKSPKHSVSVSTGLSVSVNGDAGDAGANAVQGNIVRSNSSSRSVFEIAEAPKDLGRTSSSHAVAMETTSFSSSSMEDGVGARGLRNGGRGQGHSRAVNGTPVATEVSDGTESQEEDEEGGPIFTQL